MARNTAHLKLGASVFRDSIWITVVSVGIANFFFAHSVVMASTGLIALGLIFPLNELLEKNRRMILEEERSPWKANKELAGEITFIFLGIFVSALLLKGLLAYLGLDYSNPHSPLFQNELSEIFQNNLRVLLGSFVLSFLFNAGGLMLILGWNALNWARSIFMVIAGQLALKGTVVAFLSSLALLPHLIFEIIAYSMAGMCGVFLAKAANQYAITSPEFLRVNKAVVAILIGAILSLGLSSLFEIYIAQEVIR